MLQELLKHRQKILLCGVLIALLALVRGYESVLFYDPLLQFFKGEYQSQPLPAINHIELSLGLAFRYAINTFLSLAVIQVAFNDRGLTRFAAILYLMFFVLLILSLLILLSSNDPNTLYIFYIRRFLIQPILLLLFLPAFYYQRKNRPNGT